MGYVACLGQISEETAHVLQNLVSANGLSDNKEKTTHFVLCRQSDNINKNNTQNLPKSNKINVQDDGRNFFPRFIATITIGRLLPP